MKPIGSTHFDGGLVLITSFLSLMAEKHKELGDAANKLRNGLDKIDDTRQKVRFFCIYLKLIVTS